jgi:hypothetical protein
MNLKDMREVDLPWSEGLLSARIWCVDSRTVVAVPELGLHCYGTSQAEALFRLFTMLLKYHRQLKAFEIRLGQRGLLHLALLSTWVQSIENKIKIRSLEPSIVNFRKNR